MTNSLALYGAIHMGKWEIVGVVVGVLVALVVLVNIKDVIRYIRISSM